MEQSRGSRRLQYAAAFSATLGYMTFGSFAGWPTPVIPRLTSNSSHITTTHDEGSWILASSSLTMVLPMLFVGYLVDVIGRKRMLLAAAVPYIGLWTIQIIATAPWMLILSRSVGAFGQSMVMTATPVYLVEIAETEIRGTIITLYQVMQNLGMLLVFCVAPYVPFRTLAGMLLSFPVLLLATFSWMPESPYYLYMRGREKESQQALMRLRGRTAHEDIEEEFELIRRSVEERRAERERTGGGYMSTLRELFGDPVNRRSLVLMVGLMSLLMWTGILVMTSYATYVFRRSGSRLDADVSSIILGSAQLAISVAASFAADRFPSRKAPLVCCFGGCALTQAVLGAYFYLMDEVGLDMTPVDWLPLTIYICFLVSVTLGPGALVWTVCGETFQPSVKGVAMSIASVTNCGMAFITLKVYHAISQYGDYLPFWLFSLCCTCGVFYVWLLVPETKGRSTDEIAKEIAGKLGIKQKTVAVADGTAEEKEKLKQ